MSVLTTIANLLREPPPSHVFELSEAGIAYSRPSGKTFETGFAPFEPGTLVVSPVEDNIRRADIVAAHIARIAPPQEARRRRPAAIILPDYAARVSVLDFDSLPAKPEEQLALIRFRLKKTLPFDVDSAAVSYFVQPTQEANRREVVAVSVAVEVVARYEALFRAAAFQPGEITTAGLAALNLYKGDGNLSKGDGPAVIAKIEGRVLTVMALVGGALKLFRCVELEGSSEDDVLGVLQPTFAYMEDELAAPGSRLVLCGFAPGALAGWKSSEILSGRFGAPGPFNAGLLGYLEGARN